MKENDKLDKWLVNSVGDYQPAVTQSSKDRFLSQAAGIKEEAASGSNAHKSNGRSYTIISLILLLTVSRFIFWQSEAPTSSFKEVSTSSVNEVSTSSVNEVSPSSVHEVSTSSVNSDSTNKSVKLNQDNPSNKRSVGQSKDSKFNQKESKYNQSNQYGSNHVQPSQTTSQIIDNDETIIESDNITANQSTYSTAREELLSENEITPIVETPNTDTTSKTETINDPEKKEPGNRLFNQSLFLYYKPEVIWNVIGNEKDVHNLGIEWNTRLFNGNYLLGTGLGVTLTKGYYEYAIEYNEYLGDYNRLDSISFNWVPERFAMEQTMYTSSEEVFDTAVTTYNARVDRKFVYLQIPLTMGYDMLRTSNTTLGLRFAPVLSVLMSKKPVDFRYETGKNKLVQINRITPDRVKTNWQLNAGLCYGRRLSESLWLELEPRFSYYFNSVYEKTDNSSSPMGASIRVAVGIKY